MFKELEQYCAPGTRPFTATVKAWLNLVAHRPMLSGALEKLAQRTLGKGFSRAVRLKAPLADSAVFIWQTVLQTPGSVARVQLPVPLDWLMQAGEPRLRVVAAWETPVNHALAESSWGCRKVNLKLRPFSHVVALRGGGSAEGAYPLIDRVFNIHPGHLKEKDFQLTDERWIIEVDYEEVGAYPPAMTFSPQQRVGVVIELLDESERSVSPQAALQALPIAAEMVRLSLLQQQLQVPVLLRS